MTSDIIERVKRHRDALGRKVIEVPEWKDDEGEPTVIYCKPITIFEMQRWYKGISSDDISVLIDLIVTKAEDEDEKKIFKLDDKSKLLRTGEFSVDSRIAGEMMEGSDEVEEIEKN